MQRKFLEDDHGAHNLMVQVKKRTLQIRNINMLMLLLQYVGVRSIGQLFVEYSASLQLTDGLEILFEWSP